MLILCSDVHLADYPSIGCTFYNFLEHIKRLNMETLWLLGDIFDCWWGDDHYHQPYLAWENYLKSLPFEIRMIRGNRDFLIGKKFSKETSIKLEDPGFILHAGRHKIALFHGDEDYLEDFNYKLIRPIFRNKLIQSLFLSLPMNAREYLARTVRKSSNPPKTLKYDYSKLSELDVDVVIHGHCHRGEILKEFQKTIMTLSSWENGSGSWVMINREGEIFFHHFSHIMDMQVIFESQLYK